VLPSVLDLARRPRLVLETALAAEGFYSLKALRPNCATSCRRRGHRL